jgi:hypothetical protein
MCPYPTSEVPMRGFGYVLVGMVVLASTWVVGSLGAAFAASLDASATGAGLAASLGLCVALPLFLSSRIVRALADRTPRRGPIHGASLLALNALTLGLLLGVAPDTTREAIGSAGDWPLFGQDVPMLSEALAAAHIGGTVAVDDEPTQLLEEAVAEVDLSVSEVEPLPTPAPLDASGVFAAAANAVVVIEVEEPAEGVLAEFMPTLRGHGSGFAVAPDLVVTNYHVAGKATALAVRTRDHQRVAAVRVASLAEDDLVLLRLVDLELPSLDLADDTVAIGAKTWAIGAPLGLEYSLTEGIVSGRRDLSGTPFLQMQTTVAPGSSGGPLLDDHARVVGVNTAVASPGLSLAVTVARVEALLALEPDAAAEPLPLLPTPITLAHVELPDDLVPTEREGLTSLLETLTAALSDEVTLEGSEGSLALAPRACQEEGLVSDCDALLEALGFMTQMLRMLPTDTLDARFTDVPRADGGTGELTLTLHRSKLPPKATAP